MDEAERRIDNYLMEIERILLIFLLVEFLRKLLQMKVFDFLTKYLTLRLKKIAPIELPFKIIMIIFNEGAQLATAVCSGTLIS